MPLVEAVIVNHNTSLFSELALRSLLASGSARDLRVTVVDNHSDDADGLRTLCEDLGAGFDLSRWPRADQTVNTHGDVLRDFVLSRPEADCYLFVDCDIDFDEPRAVDTMLADLHQSPDLWAVQARFRSAETRDGAGGSMHIWAGRPVSLRLSRDDREAFDDARAVRGRIQPRCHPGCTLVANSPSLRRVAETIGFACAVVLSQDESSAGWYDTMGLASAAMSVAGYRYELSRATVHHFFNASYDDQHKAEREEDCRRRLERFRQGHTSRGQELL